MENPKQISVIFQKSDKQKKKKGPQFVFIHIQSMYKAQIYTFLQERITNSKLLSLISNQYVTNGWSIIFLYQDDFSAPLKWCLGHVPPFSLPQLRHCLQLKLCKPQLPILRILQTFLHYQKSLFLFLSFVTRFYWKLFFFFFFAGQS